MQNQDVFLRAMSASVVLLAVMAITTSPRKTVTIGIGGDTMIGRSLSDVIQKMGPEYPWGTLLPLMRRTDFNLVNLETTFTKSTDPVPKVFNFKSDPDNVRALVAANIQVVSLANNHSKDFGNQGLIDTMQTLQSAGIKWAGAGMDSAQARKPVLISKNGITIAVIGATDNEPTWKADLSTPGTNYFEVTDTEQLLSDIKAAKKDADIVIVSLHWGPNMRQRPTKEFQLAAREMVEAGADIVHGHSAHIFQGVAWHNGSLILYDTGDLVDDYAVDPALRNDQALFFEVTVTKQGVLDFAVTPLLISNFQVNRATGQEKGIIMQKLERLSKELEA